MFPEDHGIVAGNLVLENGVALIGGLQNRRGVRFSVRGSSQRCQQYPTVRLRLRLRLRVTAKFVDLGARGGA